MSNPNFLIAIAFLAALNYLFIIVKFKMREFCIVKSRNGGVLR